MVKFVKLDDPQNTLRIGFDSFAFILPLQGTDLLYYTTSKHLPKFQSKYITLSATSKEQKNEILLTDIARGPFDPFTFYLRVMENIGYDSVYGNPSMMYDMSRLSHGVKCAMQGCKYFISVVAFASRQKYNSLNNLNRYFLCFSVPVYALFGQSGLFIWWPKENDINVTTYIIQFLHNDTTNPTVFSEHIVGTTKLINEFHSQNDIEGDLMKIAAKTKVYVNAFVGDIENATITEIRVAGNVTGILIPNANRLVVRVLVPVFDEDGEVYQDMRYVEWKTVR